MLWINNTNIDTRFRGHSASGATVVVSVVGGLVASLSQDESGRVRTASDNDLICRGTNENASC